MKQSLDSRLSKAQVTAIAGNLHHDECGIEAMFSQMKQTGTPPCGLQCSMGAVTFIQGGQKNLSSPALWGVGRYGNICKALFSPWAVTGHSR